ncbi:SpoIIE family protein phosphatase [Cellulomonas alba]|uniref:SpoIIE family protein phosphatase n=1 Tax=Cellulomonas alba TaxID=3053467 RepID=A0ABT7SG43_9CELL|nr:SpoIIE family protein phosphatase [Cellulomonas alba]MDM7855019.1 SpoIIE family protein phosphatase [Cellulomonas alba]
MTDGLSVVVTDPRQPDDPIIWVSEGFTRLTGYDAQSVLGRNCRLLQGPRTESTSLMRLREGLAQGQVVSELLLNYRRDGSPFWNRVVIGNVRDESGQVTYRVGVQADVTDSVEAALTRDAGARVERETTIRLDLLARVSDELTARLDYHDAVDALGDLAVPALATWGFVAVTDDRGRYEHVHLATSEPDLAAAIKELANEDLGWLYGAPSVTAALTSGPGFIAAPYRVARAGIRDYASQRQYELFEELGLGSALVLPLRGRDRVLGVIAFVSRDLEAFSPEVVVTAAHLGRRAGLALDNTRLFLAERSAALTLQHRLLPAIPKVEGLDVAAAYVPSARSAEVGGDWFDVLPLADGSLGLAVGDVVGHDMRAAAAMGQLRSLLRSAAWEGSSPAAVIARVDTLVRGLDIADIATCVYARWQSADDAVLVTYARAGHPPAMLRLPGGEVRVLNGGGTTPLGVGPVSDSVRDGAVSVPPGAMLVLYTDGLVERRDRGLRGGIDELVHSLESVGDDVDAQTLVDTLVRDLVGAQQEDDLCLLVVRRP